MTGAALRDWLAHRAPQAPSGAYCGWLDGTTRLPSYPYPEITGYLLTLAAYGRWSPAEVPGPARAAAWLASSVADGPLDCRPDRPGATVYLFDLGMIAQGLLRYGTHLGDQRLVDSGLAVVGEVRRHLPPDLAWLHPIAGGGRPSPTWSTAGTTHLLKLLLPLCTAAELGDRAAGRDADRIAASAHASLDPQGAPPIVTCPGAEVVSLHAACYAAEGLWAYGQARHRPDATGRATEITRWVWRQQLPDGGFPGFVTNDGRAVGDWQSDVLAQAVRLGLLTGVRVDGLDRAVAAIVASASADGPGTAIRYSPRSPLTHLNTWATMFAAQALDLHDPPSPESPRRQLAWRDLV
nr:hypothetical protein [Micromonospora sp. DSM 115978]